MKNAEIYHSTPDCSDRECKSVLLYHSRAVFTVAVVGYPLLGPDRWVAKWDGHGVRFTGSGAGIRKQANREKD